MEEELRIARQIQMSLLPRGPLDSPGIAVTALCVPARAVGGDYYDFFRVGTRVLCVLLADVSGKGTSAALYMAELKGLMLSPSQIHQSPRQLLIAVNRIIAENLDTRSFITMTYFFFSSRRRHTRFDCDWSSDVCSSDLGPVNFSRSPVGTSVRMWSRPPRKASTGSMTV